MKARNMCRPAPRTIPFAVGFMLTLGAIANAQTNAKLPEFEVASVKPIDDPVVSSAGVRVLPGGRVVISDLSLKALITVAFRLFGRSPAAKLGSKMMAIP